MSIHIFNDKKLAEKLQNNNVNDRQKMIYLLIMNTVTTLFMCNTFGIFIWENVTITFYDWIYDAISILGIAFIVHRSFIINQSGDAKDFVTRFICLNVPIIIKVLLLSIIFGLVGVALDLFLSIRSHLPADEATLEPLIKHEMENLNTGPGVTTALLLITLYALRRFIACFRIAASVETKAKV